MLNYSDQMGWLVSYVTLGYVNKSVNVATNYYILSR